jgi:hypothetical protein
MRVSRALAIAVAGILIVVIQSIHISAAQEIDASGLLDAMRGADERMFDDVTIEATVSWPMFTTDIDSAQRIEDVRYTTGNDTWAMRMTPTADMPEPKYVKPSASARSGSFIGASGGTSRGDITVQRPQYTAFYAAEGVSGFREKTRLVKLTPANTVVMDAMAQEVASLHKSYSPLREPRMYVPVLGSGRGFSPYLKEITSIERREDGTILCRASGLYPNERATTIIWDLEIDPDEGYLVRRAVARSPYNLSAMSEFEMTGLVMSDTGAIARKAKIRLFVHDEALYRDNGHHDVVYRSFSAGTDSALLEEVRTAVLGPYPDGVFVVDKREDGEARIYTAGEEVTPTDDSSSDCPLSDTDP